ncbi:MAG: Bax inhibitor-1/YccA family protein [Alphaproteobacteria bacterium]|nr:Bax inhibitor-1/YccA family protein [Alphaproteobacteria bacterium]
MAEQYRSRYPAGARTADASIDQGLRSYMLRIYNYMASGVLLTGIVSYALASWVVNNPEVAQTLYSGPLAWVIMLSPLAMVLVMSFGLNKLSPFALQACFWTFATLMGLSLSSIFLVYTGESIARTFFVAAAAFGGLSLWGYTTKKDLTGWGSFLIMGLFGIIIAAVVNIFLQSSMMDFVISCVGVLVFAGLTAYDTQKIKEMYYEGDGEAVATKKSVMAALSLYLDFINLFLMLLRLMGSRE